MTIQCLLKDEFASQFFGNTEQSCSEANGNGCKPIIGNTGWRFCDSPDCDVVYFSEDGDTTFAKSQLKVAVGVKESKGERPLCYCFGHSITSISNELEVTGHSDALDDIRAKMKNPGCHCETMNPSGSCCLGSVARGIRIAQAESGKGNSDRQPRSVTARVPSNQGERIAKIGTLVSAVVASSCCWLPLVLLAAGVSGVGIAAKLEAYRPLFIAVTFGFLGAAFYFTYRRTNVIGDEDCCAPQGGCRPSATKRRVSMMTLNRVMLWVVTLFAVTFLFIPSYIGVLLGSNGEAVTVNMNRSVIQIDGMTCEGCASIVSNVIRKVPGVQAVEVDYEKREAVVGTEICCPVPQAAILIALDEAGYSGQIIRDKSSPIGDSASTNQEAPLVDLSPEALEFRSAFNNAKGNVRVVMLVSPG